MTMSLNWFDILSEFLLNSPKRILFKNDTKNFFVTKMSTRAKKRVSCVPDHGKTCFRAKKCTFRTLTIFMKKITFSHLLISSDEKYCMILVRKHFFAFTLIILYYNTRFARIVNRIIRVKCKKVTFSHSYHKYLFFQKKKFNSRC